MDITLDKRSQNTASILPAFDPSPFIVYKCNYSGEIEKTPRKRYVVVPSYSE